MQRKFILIALCLTVVTACGPIVRTARQQGAAGSVPDTETTRVPAAVSATTATSTSEVQAAADWVWTYSQAHPEGFTVDIHGREVPTEGLSVAYAATQGRHTKEDLGEVVSHALAHDGYVGGWWNSEDSLYYFDSVRILPESNPSEAVSFALENEQLAFYVLSTGEEVRIDRVIHPHEIEPSNLDGWSTVFLAGTIDNGNSEDWQQTVAAKLAGRDRRYLLYNPRQEDWHPEREGEMDYQVHWELEHMEKADHILMVFLDGSQSPITLLELGLHARSGKLLVVCTPGFYRYDNVRITCARYGLPVYGSIDEALEALP